MCLFVWRLRSPPIFFFPIITCFCCSSPTSFSKVWSVLRGMSPSFAKDVCLYIYIYISISISLSFSLSVSLLSLSCLPFLFLPCLSILSLLSLSHHISPQNYMCIYIYIYVPLAGPLDTLPSRPTKYDKKNSSFCGMEPFEWGFGVHKALVKGPPCKARNETWMWSLKRLACGPQTGFQIGHFRIFFWLHSFCLKPLFYSVFVQSDGN